tara:strand:+ start:2971 stop:3144 length:174 start_codon:yes stop_codon:yes gene_type:complete
MIEAILILPIMWVTMICVYLLLVRNLEGSKGIEKDIYYGRRTGKKYTATKERADHII